MNKKELKTIAKNEYLEIGNHTVNHPFLTTGNEEDIENEILILSYNPNRMVGALFLIISHIQ